MHLHIPISLTFSDKYYSQYGPVFIPYQNSSHCYIFLVVLPPTHVYCYKVKTKLWNNTVDFPKAVLDMLWSESYLELRVAADLTWVKNCPVKIYWHILIKMPNWARKKEGGNTGSASFEFQINPNNTGKLFEGKILPKHTFHSHSGNGVCNGAFYIMLWGFLFDNRIIPIRRVARRAAYFQFPHSWGSHEE